MTESTTESTTEKKVRNAYPDRLTVEPANLEKIGRLLDQLRAATPACEATRKDILNWLVERAPEELGASDLKDLSDRFYDEERFLKLALEEVREAKARGERLRLEDILSRNRESPTPERRPRRRRKAAGLSTEDPAEPAADVAFVPEST